MQRTPDSGAELRTVSRVAMVAMHSSPRQAAGTGDSGGMSVLLLALAGELAGRGIEVDLLARASGTPRVSTIAPGVTVHELPAGGARVLQKGQLGEVIDDFGEQVGRLARQRRYDLIHAHYWLSGLAALPVALELGLPFVQSFHTLAAMKNANRAPGQAPEPERRLASERFLAAQADAVIAGSAAEAAALVEAVTAPADRIWVIPPGVDVDLFRPDRASAESAVRARLGVQNDRPILAVVGRVQPLKNQEQAVRMLAELQARGHPAVLVIAGEATPGADGYAAALRTSAERLGVTDDVRFVGALSRTALADLLATASVTIVPSYTETFGLVALESAASGTPVLGFRGTGLAEAVAPGKSGILVDSWDPAVWAKAAASILHDPALAARLSASSRLHALDFTWPVSAAALLGIYGSLLG